MADKTPVAGAAEKQCPYCAETIKAAAVRCRFCQADLVAQLDPTDAPPGSCGRCRVPLVAEQRKASVSLAGLVGVVGFFVGLALVFVNPILGGGVIIAALVISSAGRGKRTVMVCPKCGDTL